MNRTFVASLLIAFVSPTRAAELPPIYTAGDATVCFTTAKKSTIGRDRAALVAEIARAERELLVQAYNFNEPRIIAAIIAAHRACCGIGCEQGGRRRLDCN